jgi:hypothetical protein
MWSKTKKALMDRMADSLKSVSGPPIRSCCAQETYAAVAAICPHTLTCSGDTSSPAGRIWIEVYWIISFITTIRTCNV